MGIGDAEFGRRLGSFDGDNDYLYLNDIPFADHGALLDPSTADLTGSSIEMLGMLGYGTGFPRMFYLRYHGYSLFFPVRALAVYARHKNGSATAQEMVRRNNGSTASKIGHVCLSARNR